MGDWFAAADLQVHPSYTEGLGSVILEGMGSGLPVIGTNAGGIPTLSTTIQTAYLLNQAMHKSWRMQ